MRTHTLPIVALAVMLAGTTAPAFGASQGTCDRYARDAVYQYRVMVEHRDCRVRDSARWQANYQNHYDWCLSAPVAWLNSEWDARNVHLKQCGRKSVIID